MISSGFATVNTFIVVKKSDVNGWTVKKDELSQEDFGFAGSSGTGVVASWGCDRLASGRSIRLTCWSWVPNTLIRMVNLKELTIFTYVVENFKDFGTGEPACYTDSKFHSFYDIATSDIVTNLECTPSFSLTSNSTACSMGYLSMI